jgi:hypothetical protein
MRKEFDVILIGGETARNEPYGKTPIPLVVISRSSTVPVMVAANPMLNLWNISPEVAIKKCQAEKFGIFCFKVFVLLLLSLLVKEAK